MCTALEDIARTTLLGGPNDFQGRGCKCVLCPVPAEGLGLYCSPHAVPPLFWGPGEASHSPAPKASEIWKWIFQRGQECQVFWQGYQEAAPSPDVQRRRGLVAFQGPLLSHGLLVCWGSS